MKNDIAQLNIVKGEHLKQKWFIDVMNLAKSKPLLCCSIISHICNDMKVTISYDENQIWREYKYCENN